MNMTAVEFEQDDEEINVDTDSRPGSPPRVQKPRISFSISALLAGDTNRSIKSQQVSYTTKTDGAADGAVYSYRDDSGQQSDDDGPHRGSNNDDRDSVNEDDREDDQYDEGYDFSVAALRPSYLAHFGPHLTHLGLPLGLPQVVRVPAQRPGYPLVAPPPWPGLSLPSIDRGVLAPHFHTLDRLPGQSSIIIVNITRIC